MLGPYLAKLKNEPSDKDLKWFTCLNCDVMWKKSAPQGPLLLLWQMGQERKALQWNLKDVP